MFGHWFLSRLLSLTLVHVPCIHTNIKQQKEDYSFEAEWLNIRWKTPVIIISARNITTVILFVTICMSCTFCHSLSDLCRIMKDSAIFTASLFCPMGIQRHADMHDNRAFNFSTFLQEQSVASMRREATDTFSHACTSSEVMYEMKWKINILFSSLF